MMNSNCNCNWGGCGVSRVMNTLVIVGGVNWGLVGLGMLFGKMDSWNVVAMVLGSMPTLEAIKAEAIRCGFDCCVLERGVSIGTWSIFGGYQDVQYPSYKPETWRV